MKEKSLLPTSFTTEQLRDAAAGVPRPKSVSIICSFPVGGQMIPTSWQPSPLPHQTYAPKIVLELGEKSVYDQIPILP